MGKDDFSNERPLGGSKNRREREEFESIEQESSEDGRDMEKKGAHSNLGVGDEETPIKENEKE